MRLEADEIEAIAERVAERLAERERPPANIGLATAAQVAKLFGVTTSWVYANKTRLGAVKLGAGPKARLRFDLERVEQELRPRTPSARGGHQRRRRGRPRKTELPPGVDLLKGRGGQ
jgi:hypothetical protein